MQVLNKDIREGTLKSVYLLYGEEEFLKQSYKRKLKKTVLDEDELNFSAYKGEDIDADEIIRMADTLPLFAPKRLIFVEDSGWFKAGKAPERIVEYMSGIPATTCLVFCEDVVEKRGKLYKAVGKYGYAAEFGRQSNAQLMRWAAARLSSDGKQIRRSTLEMFLEKTGDDMVNISSELEKLVSFTLGRKEITSEDVEAVCCGQVTGRVFDMVSAIAAKDTKKALGYYGDLLTLKEPPLRILFLVGRQFNELLQVKDLMAAKASESEIAVAMKLSSYRIRRLMRQAREFSGRELTDWVGLCTELEERVKLGDLQERLAVELVIAGTQIPDHNRAASR